MMNFLIDLFTETGIIVDSILILTGIVIYLMIKEDNEKVEELEGGTINED